MVTTFAWTDEEKRIDDILMFISAVGVFCFWLDILPDVYFALLDHVSRRMPDWGCVCRRMLNEKLDNRFPYSRHCYVCHVISSPLISCAVSACTCCEPRV